MNAVAIVTAGGRGLRLGGEVPKQFLPLRGIPLIVHTLRACARAKSVSGIVVTLPAEMVDAFEKTYVRPYDVPKFLRAVAGGATRQASVHAGLRALPATCGIVAIHDAARCLVTPEIIDESIRRCSGADGAIVASPVRDSIKRVHDGTIVATVPRADLWAMQTPQTFHRDFILRAYDRALAEGVEATDDAEVAERAGGRVAILEGPASNLKVTYAEDLVFAEEHLRRREP